jgi:hypothetical protein
MPRWSSISLLSAVGTVMHKWVTHNRHYATFNQFTEAIFDFFRKTLPEKWPEFRNTVTDNFRVVSLKEYKVI